MQSTGFGSIVDNTIGELQTGLIMHNYEYTVVQNGNRGVLSGSIFDLHEVPSTSTLPRGRKWT